MTTPLDTASTLMQLAVRTAQQSFAQRTEVGVDVLRLAVELLGHDEAIRRIELMRRQSVPPPPSSDGDVPPRL